MIVGVAGAIGAGKDVVASYLARQYGFVRRGFADALKDEVLERLPRTLRAILAKELGFDVVPALAATMIDRMVRVDKPPIVRALLQEWGTELRRAEDPDYWTRQWRRWVDAHPGPVVAPDVRFPNEVAAVLDAGGVLIRVERPGHAGDSHASETALAGFTDWTIFVNDGSIADLEAQVGEWLEEVAHGHRPARQRRLP